MSYDPIKRIRQAVPWRVHFYGAAAFAVLLWFGHVLIGG